MSSPDAELLLALNRIQRSHWHGNLHREFPAIERFVDDGGEREFDYPYRRKLARTAHEFALYIRSNMVRLIH